MTSEKLQELTRDRKKAHQKLLDTGSRVYRAFIDIEQATFTDGALKRKEKELIAVGISVRIDCESCMQWHIEQAAASGAGYDEVLEAVEVGIEMGAVRPRYRRDSRSRSWTRCSGPDPSGGFGILMSSPAG